MCNLFCLLVTVNHLIVQNTLFKSKTGRRKKHDCTLTFLVWLFKALFVSVVEGGTVPVFIGRPVNSPHLCKNRVNSSCYVLQFSILRIEIIKKFKNNTRLKILLFRSWTSEPEWALAREWRWRQREDAAHYFFALNLLVIGPMLIPASMTGDQLQGVSLE